MPSTLPVPESNLCKHRERRASDRRRGLNKARERSEHLLTSAEEIADDMNYKDSSI